MREFIFRGKRKYSDGKVGGWVYGSLSVMSGGGHAFIIDHGADCIYEVAPDTVGQYTGLEDCTGVMRIYEGDIIKDKSCNSMGKVEYYMGGFVVKTGGGWIALAQVNEYRKVIGNVYNGVEGVSV